MHSNAALKESTTPWLILVSMVTRVPGSWHAQQEMLQISTAVSSTRNKSPIAILNIWESKNTLCVCVCVCARARAVPHAGAQVEIYSQNHANVDARAWLSLQINMLVSNVTHD